jgi:hypothetical protein
MEVFARVGLLSVRPLNGQTLGGSYFGRQNTVHECYLNTNLPICKIKMNWPPDLC